MDPKQIYIGAVLLIINSKMRGDDRDTSNLTSAKNAVLLETVDSENYITIDDCRRAGEKWIIANYSESTEIREILPIKNLNERLTGYCINFSTDVIPNGYLVLDANKYAETYIKEFAFDGNGIYDTLTAAIPAKGRATTLAAPVIYSTNPYQYAVKYAQGDEVLFYNSDCSIMTVSDEVNTYECGDTLDYVELSQQSEDSGSKVSIYEAFFDKDDLSSYTWLSVNCIPNLLGFKPFTMSELRMVLTQIIAVRRQR